MNRIQPKLVILILGLLAVILLMTPIVVSVPPVEKFSVGFEAYPSLDHVCFIDSITNLQDSNDDFPYKTVLNDTNIDISTVEVRLWEEKEEEYVSRRTTNITTIEKCVTEINGTSCWNETTVLGHDEIIDTRNVWVERNLFQKNEDGNEVSHQFEEIHIKKYETKRFKRCYYFGDIPLLPDGWGSYGTTYIEVKDKLYYDKTNSSWWNVAWTYKDCFNLTNNDDETLNNATFNKTFDIGGLVAGGKLQADFDDLRVVENGSMSTINHNYTVHNTTTLDVYFKLDNITAGEKREICYYYGNAGASDGTALWRDVYLEYDNFDDDSIDTNLWNVTGNDITEGGGMLNVYQPDASWTADFIQTIRTFDLPVRIDFEHNRRTSEYSELSWAENNFMVSRQNGSRFYIDGGGDNYRYYATKNGGFECFDEGGGLNTPGQWYNGSLMTNSTDGVIMVNGSVEASCSGTIDFDDMIVVISGYDLGGTNANLSVNEFKVSRWLSIVETYSAFGGEEVAITSQINVTLNFPANGTWNITSPVNFGFTPDSALGYLNCSLWITNRTNENFTVNITNTSAIVNDTVNVIAQTLLDGNYTHNIECCDNASVCNMSIANYTFKLDTTNPVSNSPADQTHFVDEPRTIGWILQDNMEAGNYTIFRDGVIQNISTMWNNNTNLQIWVDTRTLGTFNYSVNFTDSTNHGGQDDVSVTITRMAEGGTGGEVPDYIPCANYTLMGDLRFGFLNVSAPPGGFTSVKTIRILNGETTNQSYSVNFTNETIGMCEFMSYNNEPVEPLSYREYVFRCVARNETVRGFILITADGCTDAYDLAISPITNVLEWFAYVWDMGLTGFIYTMNTPFVMFGFVFPAWLIILIILMVVFLILIMW